MGDSIAYQTSPTFVEPPPERSFFFQYKSVAGFFQQDDPATDGRSFDYQIVNEAADTTQWARFEHYINGLNQDSENDTSFKVLYLGRHGEGYHNVAEAFYGTSAWDCHWSKLDGNGTISWRDARLTDKGITQALAANQFWKTHEDVPRPQSYYSSPLDRCCATASLTFDSLPLPEDRPFKPVLKELLREALGVHTCDARSSKSEIHSRWPDFAFEDGFAESDPLWTADLRESDSHLTARLKKAMEDIFYHDSNTFLSVTAHSGAIAGALRAFGHVPFALQTGGVIPVLLKVSKVYGQKPVSTILPGTPPPSCPGDATAATGAV
ncbi:phosphoglycerate mutase-like protein [Tothia fuscella]|uniref:Phosphoglycerate mutase-like protein n=1 Tax=Tothia fuscella TaxID=1048955 RepID=A0A9P4P343_9PEZI|nr:phosphoglycerate mutase-like protein [Tothia fuscella]